jgi:hypothetical protein
MLPQRLFNDAIKIKDDTPTSFPESMFGAAPGPQLQVDIAGATEHRLSTPSLVSRECRQVRTSLDTSKKNGMLGVRGFVKLGIRKIHGCACCQNFYGVM